jgi:triphosphoribosyl-dephospho-CoA synthase
MNVEQCVLTACLWEVSARKAGNVHRFADFDNLTYLDFVQSAAAIAPVFERDLNKPLGISILDTIRATRAVARTNTNLGMTLLLAPLSKCEPAQWRPQLEAQLAAATIDDAKNVYEAIRLAEPGGLGNVDNQDVADEPTQTLREVMALAADRDLVARQYANCFREVLDDGVPALLDGMRCFGSIEAAILHLQIHLLSAYPDTLIVRKRGMAIAEQVRARAREIDLKTAVGRQRFLEFDHWLREGEDGHARNPGTTADLVAACLFVALRDGKLNPLASFAWNELPTFHFFETCSGKSLR